MSHFDLLIIGTGSGNSLLGDEHADLEVAICERSTFGGTCLNRGCIPTKMLVHAADVAFETRHSGRLGVDTALEGVRWSDMQQRIFANRIDPIAESGEAWRRGDENPHVTVFDGSARFVGPKQIDVGGGHIVTADQIVIAAGGRPFVPDIEGLDSVGYHTSDDVMRLDDLPDRMIILGGGFIAMEFAHIFDALGVSVTVINRSDRLLRAEDTEISERFTRLGTDRFDCRLGTMPTLFEQADDGEITVTLDSGDQVRGEVLLVATGRTPNSDELDVAATGVTTDDAGLVITDDTLETEVSGIWALGDIANDYQLKHLANLEARIVRHNLSNGDDRRTVDRSLTPHAVFTSPQIGSVGATQQALDNAGTDYLVGQQEYRNTAYGWALEDEDGFCKVLVDPDTRLLLGAHVMGPMAASMVQLLVQGMAAGQTVDELARAQQYIHPAPTELIEQALLDV